MARTALTRVTTPVPRYEAEDTAVEKPGQISVPSVPITEEYYEPHTIPSSSLCDPIPPTLTAALQADITAPRRLHSASSHSLPSVFSSDEVREPTAVPTSQDIDEDQPLVTIAHKPPAPNASHCPQASDNCSTTTTQPAQPLPTYSSAVNNLETTALTFPSGLTESQLMHRTPSESCPRQSAPAIALCTPEDTDYEEEGTQDVCAMECTGQIADYRLRALPPPPYVEEVRVAESAAEKS